MKKSTKAFTLIELLVVVLIIGILSAIALPQYQKSVFKAKVAEAKVALRAIYDAENIYALANGNCGTRDFTQLDISVPSSSYWNYGMDDGYLEECYSKGKFGGYLYAAKADDSTVKIVLSPRVMGTEDFICHVEDADDTSNTDCPKYGAIKGIDGKWRF